MDLSPREGGERVASVEPFAGPVWSENDRWRDGEKERNEEEKREERRNFLGEKCYEESEEKIGHTKWQRRRIRVPPSRRREVERELKPLILGENDSFKSWTRSTQVFMLSPVPNPSIDSRMFARKGFDYFINAEEPGIETARGLTCSGLKFGCIEISDDKKKKKEKKKKNNRIASFSM
ncbi:unnamed protein product [Dovyalis caffra]|uniref:Uncharacterized protein n=1 Tax=Dovyalis caffra TaxID=77055 RepID=A0AAV1RKR8_9ROSI|nr:unnamed protein product [Dovyalis caffra]